MQLKHCFIQLKLVRLCIFYQIHVDMTLIVLQTISVLVDKIDCIGTLTYRRV